MAEIDCTDITKAQKKRMILSTETMLGLRITGTNFSLHVVLINDVFYSKVIYGIHPIFVFSSGSER